MINLPVDFGELGQQFTPLLFQRRYFHLLSLHKLGHQRKTLLGSHGLNLDGRLLVVVAHASGGEPSGIGRSHGLSWITHTQRI